MVEEMDINVVLNPMDVALNPSSNDVEATRFSDSGTFSHFSSFYIS
jgi:hypothetical protein